MPVCIIKRTMLFFICPRDEGQKKRGEKNMTKTYRKMIDILDKINDKAENNAPVPYDLLVEYYAILKQYHEEESARTA